MCGGPLASHWTSSACLLFTAILSEILGIPFRPTELLLYPSFTTPRENVLSKGFDINKERIAQLEKGTDPTFQMTEKELSEAVHLSYTMNPNDIKDCKIFIVTVPTPIDKHKRPVYHLSSLVH